MGGVSFHTDDKNNKSVIENHVLYGKKENEQQWYRGLIQRGTTVYLLGQNKSDGKYWIDMIYCERWPERYDNFYYKMVSAIPNAAYGVIPKNWLEKLEKTEEVVKFIEGNNAFLEKKKMEAKNFPDYKSIANGTKFACHFKKPAHTGNFSIQAGDIYDGTWWGDALYIRGAKLSKNRIKHFLEKMVPAEN